MFVLVAAALYLSLVLTTFNRADPGWSHSVAAGEVRNLGGRVGAWIADMLLLLFGVSAWWCVALPVFAAIWTFRRLEGGLSGDRRSFAIALTGFAVLLLASSGFEALRLHSLRISLPLAPGGLLGDLVARVLQSGFGFTGATLIRIEPPVVEIPKSSRVQRERQEPLFRELPDTPLPPIRLLDEAAGDVEVLSADTLEYTSRLIEKKLGDFGVQVKVLAAYPGPVITRYEVEPAVGVKGSQIVNLVKDLARALSVYSIRVVETIPGKSCMGLEIPNPHRQTVRLSEILGSEAYHALHAPLALALGKDIAGNPVVVDLARMPHLLVAGTTGSGKSVALNAMILSLLYKSEPREVRLILVDPKMLELSAYQDIPHLLTPVVTDMRQAANALAWCMGEVERRY